MQKQIFVTQRNDNSKRNFIRKLHKSKGKYLQLHLNEFVYKINRRYFDEKLFNRLVISKHYRVMTKNGQLKKFLMTIANALMSSLFLLIETKQTSMSFVFLIPKVVFYIKTILIAKQNTSFTFLKINWENESFVCLFVE